MLPRLESAESKLIIQDLQFGVATCRDIADAIGIAENTAWRHLKDLVDAGVVKKYSFERTNGKPAVVYGLAGRKTKQVKFRPMSDAERSAKYRRKKDEKLQSL